ncbi:helix-turn-helix domain-containing protein [Mesorhizobium sp. M0276]|uniref:TetR/AcrR family transcriptional regulator n=1 Tax=Mesorhizobium sp. M0276 TaxID=2956928 RepID=UPI0033389550
MKPPSIGRERIVRAAIRLFGERGYDRTSVPDIQEAAGLSRGSGALYKHFSSKEDLLAAAIEQFVGTAREGRAELGEKALSSEEGSRRLVGSMLEKLGANREVNVLPPPGVIC